ncbi:leucine-rich repeat-containing protein 28-like [Eriocheir sinensis]|uniref:leucine-rich repeat-containing protein 28-like n=1 Tax=Eriocheir sinensis TaxID=95602 RepID=UPI0021C9A534|nr:leucine-rich repeat-containing protein 28-like [Eriocheir sinensis]
MEVKVSIATNSAHPDLEAQDYFLGHMRKQTTRLFCNFRQLRSLPPELTQEGSHIEKIHLQGNELTRLPHDFGCLTQLTCCYLKDNYIEVLPDSVGDLKALTILDVGNNNLRALPPSLGSLPSLRSLGVVNNKLAAFPQELCSLKSLSILTLSGNQLTSLPSGMKGLRGLMGLYLDHNRLRELPISLTDLPVLARISFCCNQITHLPARPFISEPKVFFDDNPIKYLPFAMVCQLRAGYSWDTIVLPTCYYIPEVAVEENTVHINLSGQTHPSALVLPKQIKTASVHIPINYTVPPLKELCLSFLYGADGTPNCNWKHFLPDRDTNTVPRVLLDALEEGPIAWCDYPECQKSIFTHAVVVVVPIAVTPKEYLACVDNLMLLYFCSDHCADQLKKYCDYAGGGMFIWLAERLRRCLRVEIV